MTAAFFVRVQNRPDDSLRQTGRQAPIRPEFRSDSSMRCPPIGDVSACFVALFEMARFETARSQAPQPRFVRRIL